MKGIATLRDVETIEASAPADLPSSTYELLQHGASIDPNAPALSFFLTTHEHERPRTWTYAELIGRITQTANFFHALGATKNTVIAFVLPNLPETHFVLWGGEAAGIIVALNPLLESAALGALLAAAGAEIIVTLAPFPGTDLWQKVSPTFRNLPSLRHVVLVNLTDHVRGPKALAAKALQYRETFRLHGISGLRQCASKHVTLHNFASGIRHEESRWLESRRQFSPSDDSSWFCTGGTTGLPKLAMRTHSNEVANAWSTSKLLDDGVGPGKVIFCGLPLFHVNGVLVTGLLPFSRGAHVILGTPQGYRGPGVVPRFWEIIEHHRINFFAGVPTLYTALLQVPIGSRDVSSLEYGLCGAAPMPTEVFRAFEERTNLRILEGYGLTEATCVTSTNPPLGERRRGSIGLRLPGQQMKTVVLDELGNYVRDCAVDEVGVVVISGPSVFKGYRNKPQNKGIWVDCRDDKRWLNTGDLARIDADGYFWLTGRTKELIIRGGHNIDPAIIEEPLHRHPGVQLAAAVGRPDPHAGELPVAYVQLKPGVTVTAEELERFVRGEIVERAAMPKAIQIIDEIPLTAVGKIYKPALKRKEAQYALEAALRRADVSFDTLEVVDNAARGMLAQLRITHPDGADSARQVLGEFALPFDILSSHPKEATHA